MAVPTCQVVTVSTWSWKWHSAAVRKCAL